MATLVTVKLKGGQVLNGLSYRMDPGAPGAAARGPTFSIQTSLGWVTVPVSEVVSIDTKAGRPT